MKKDHNGFTLVECLVCLAVISVLATICSSSLSTLQERMRFRSELATLMSSLQRAKMSSIKINSYVVLQVKANGYDIFEDDGAGGGVLGDWIRQGGEKVLIDRNLPGDMSLTTTLTLGRSRFNGQPGMKAGTLFLNNINGKTAQIVIDTVGRIRN